MVAVSKGVNVRDKQMEEATCACLKDDLGCMVEEATDSTGYACKTEEGFVSVSVCRGWA